MSSARLMAKKPKSPILPSNPRDPTGIDRLECGAILDFSRRLRKVRRAYIAALKRIPADPIATNRKEVDAKRYTYRLDQYLLQSIMAGLDAELSAILLDGGEDHLWFFDAYVSVAAVRGTAQTFANLAQQSEAYRAGRGSVNQILASEPYRRRMAIIQARVFEDMEGFTATTKSAMSRVLTEGIGRGLNPLTIARNLNDRVGTEEGRARRIARSEVPMALRRARWDEADEAAELYGLRTKELHLSALSPTTRATHAARHAHLYTREAVRDWYAVDGNSINCKCSTASVMVDESGNPLVPSIVERAKQTMKIMEKRDYDWSKPKK